MAEIIITSKEDLSEIIQSVVRGVISELIKPQVDVPDEDEIMNIRDASKLTGYAVQSIYQKIKDIPHSKKFGKLFFSKKDLQQWIAEGKRKTTDELLNEAEEKFIQKQRNK